MSIRFGGNDNNCLKVSNMTDEDQCIFDPSKCSILSPDQFTGLSFSVWINLPNTFDTQKRYIIDTGADEYGSPGVAMYYMNSPDGIRFNQQLFVVVSTSNNVWKTVVNGLLRPYEWNNVGVRWTANADPTDKNPIGLQVFINKRSVAWKRLPTSVNSTNVNLGKTMTFGCRLDGSHVMSGRLDNVAFWYWRLDDSSNNRKPITTVELGQVNYFDGDIEFSPNPEFCDLESCLPGEAGEPPKPETTPSPAQNPFQQAPPWLEDTGLAIDGDCNLGDPNTWNGKHPINCADTRREMQSAIEFRDDFKSDEYLHALIRVVNKAGPSGLKGGDVEWLYSSLYAYGFPRLDHDLLVLSNGDVQVSYLESYMDLVMVVSKLSESAIYNSYWKSTEMKSSKAGLTGWVSALTEWLLKVSAILPDDGDQGLRSANNTAATMLRFTAEPPNLMYPDYSKMNKYPIEQDFWTIRSKTWGITETYLQVPSRLLKLVSDSNVTTQLIAMLYSTYDENMPAYLDDRVAGDGIGSISFTVNSRVISLFGQSDGEPISDAFEIPFIFTVRHQQMQDERPFLKGAVLCARWNYNSINNNSIGAWDTLGCQLLSTNDTHSTCSCSQFGDYATLVEKHVPVDSIDQIGYYVCLGFYVLSILCLVLFIVVIATTKQLHYEIHLINCNVAVCALFSLVTYLVTWIVYADQVSCIAASVFMHYCYMCMYLWLVLSAHYVFRAITAGLLGRIHYYCYIGYGLPAFIVAVCAGPNVLLYGAGTRCFGSTYNNFNAVFIGSFLMFCGIALPLVAISLCNVHKNAVKDLEDWSDVKHGMFGILIFWPIGMLVWLMAIFVYVVPSTLQLFDFLFELFNSLQGILIFVLLGVLIPSFRKGLLCRYRNDEGNRKKRNWTLLYLNH